jgi:hypothetical protein
MLPSLREVFEDVTGCGRYWSGDRVIELADPYGQFLARRSTDPMWGRVILRSAEAEGGLESSTARGAWLDEAGQDSFRIESWYAVLRRLSLHRARALLTTTLFNFHWLKSEVHDRAVAGDPDYAVIHFDSTENPAFPPQEWERARRTMPPWRFAMQYQGRYEKPAGSIYDCFDSRPYPFGHVEPSFTPPVSWKRSIGLDFGGQNTAAVFLAQDEAGLLHAYREYHAGSRTAAEHTKALLKGEPTVPVCVGGSPSEGQWRAEFGAAGLPIHPPAVSDVEVGIGRVYGTLKAKEIVFQAHLDRTLRELQSYSRKLDRSGEPTEQIENKSQYHACDSLRYIVGCLKRSIPTTTPAVVGPGYELNGYLGPPRARR